MKFILERRGDTGGSWKFAAPGDEDEFYLAKSQVTVTPIEGDSTMAEVEVPEWLAKRHRQLVGDEVFEAEKARLAQMKGKK